MTHSHEPTGCRKPSRPCSHAVLLAIAFRKFRTREIVSQPEPMDPGASSGPPDWCHWMDEAQIHAHAGYCYMRLGDHTRARGHLRNGLRLQHATYSRACSSLSHEGGCEPYELL
jgi:hypothetical protein